MKKFFITTMMLLVLTSTFAQEVPQSVNFQGVARKSGVILKNTTLRLRLQIRKNWTGGTLIYCETNTANTNMLGVFSMQLNRGNASSGCLGNTTLFSNIDWSQKNLVLKFEIEENGNYSFVDSALLASNFYSLLANQSITVKGINVSNAAAGDVLMYNSATQTFEPKKLPVNNDNDPANEVDTLKLNSGVLTNKNKNSQSSINLPNKTHGIVYNFTTIGSTARYLSSTPNWIDCGLDFNAPDAGFYWIQASVFCWAFVSNDIPHFRIYNQTTNTTLILWTNAVNGDMNATNSIMAAINKGDKIKVQVAVYGNASSNYAINHPDYFSNIQYLKLY